MKEMDLKFEKIKGKILNLPDTVLFFASFLCAMCLWPLDLYLYADLDTPLYIFIKIFFISLFIIMFWFIVLFSFVKRGNLFPFGFIILIIAFFFIILPFFKIYLPLYEEVPWGNTLASETYYLGCALLLCGGFLLNYDLFFKKKRIILNPHKLSEETKERITRSFLILSGMFFAFNLLDFNGLILPIYYGLEYAPEPLILEKVPLFLQFILNSVMIIIWLSIFIYFLHKKRYLNDKLVKISLISLFGLIFVSILLILFCKNIPITHELLRYILQPIPSWLIIVPLLVIIKVNINLEKKRV